MNGFVGWVLFITVNCMTPQADVPDIYVIKAAHPDFGPIQATVVMCEKGFDAGIPDRYRPPREGHQTDVRSGSQPADAIAPNAGSWPAEHSWDERRDTSTQVSNRDYKPGRPGYLGHISNGN